MEIFKVCAILVAGYFGFIFIISGYAAAACRPSCLEAPGNETGPVCNETTQECLYGCQEGFGGSRCQFRCANNCSYCTVEKCTENCNETCDISTCNQTEACTEGCSVGLYGPNCSLECPEHCLNSTCDRENGTCKLGCEEDFFGDMCKKNIADANCNPTCLKAPEENPGFPCNETTLECLYGCQQGYGGERCQYRCAENCTNCTVVECGEDCSGTCANGTCYHKETCIERCLDGFYGQNCSLTCPNHCTNSTCERETGICSFGCEGDFLGDKCEKTCGLNCADAPGNQTGSICNTTTLECLHGCKGNFEGGKCNTCKRAWTGDQCQVPCDYNCLECTWKESNNGTVDTGCDICYRDYYLDEQTSKCSHCSNNCFKKPSSALPTCDQVTGLCTFGCISNWGGENCNEECGAWCVTPVCYGKGACCTDGCKYNTYGGCQCNEACATDCVGGTCFQNKTCMDGCPLNKWGNYCNKTCSNRCKEGPDNSSSLCDRNGVCEFGCNKTFWGRDCSDDCAMNCLEKDCNSTTGHCLQGCKKGFWGYTCEKNCSTNCLQADCDHKNATCNLGCLTGLHGLLCTETCPENCLNSTCFRQNGTCSLGCKEGFTGEKCDVQIHPPPPPVSTDLTIVAGTAGGAGAGFIALIVVALILRNRYIAYKEAACMKEKNRKTAIEQDDLKKRRRDRKDDAAALIVVNPGYDETNTGSNDTKERFIKVDGLMDLIMKTDEQDFAEEFQMLPANVQKPAKQRKNTSKASGRKVTFSDSDGANIHDNPTFDDSNALVIKENEVNQESERMYNASIIEVYSMKYLAAEGPSSSTLVDFWLLVWKQGTTLVVMLTPTSINKQSSSIRYWPEHKGEYGSIIVTSIKEDTYANFTVREFTMERNGQTRTIYHVQLLLWPDANKFPNIADFMDFYMHYRAISDKVTEPPLVHCSDGEGRTGVFIAMDILVRYGESNPKVSVLNCVKILREERENMVQNKEMYIFLYKLVAQTLQMHCKAITEKDFIEYHKMCLQDSESNPIMTNIEDSYENMRAAVVLKPVDEESIKRQWKLKKHNREEADIPEDQYRPALLGGAYINAAYIDTLQKKDLITTQMPLPKTVGDFCRLLASEKCHVIVMLNPLNTKDKTLGVYWPLKGDMVKHENIYVRLDETTETENFTLKTLTLFDGSTKRCCRTEFTEEEEHQVSLFQYRNWESGSRPSDTSSMLRLIQAVKKERETYDDGPVLVHCLNGSEKSGLFCALYELMDAIEKELKFSVINTAYKIKYRRPSAILNLDQYKFMHEALETFITKEEFRGEPVAEAEVPLILEDDDDR